MKGGHLDCMTISWGLRDAWLLDIFKKMFEKSFTYDNGREGTNATLTKFNKFYMFNGLEKLDGKIGVLVSFNKIFNHFLVTLWIRLALGGANLGPQMFDLTFLEDENQFNGSLEGLELEKN
jgi:hypothetical protein